MLEYVFFHRRPFERFVAFLRGEGLAPRCREAQDQLQVDLSEELDEGLSERIEAFCEEMMAWNRRLEEEAEAGQDGERPAAGVVVQRRDGRAVYAGVGPELLGRVMAVLSPEALGALVDAIVDAVEYPDERSLCRRSGEADGWRT